MSDESPRKNRILVVEDDEATRESVVIKLQKKGFEADGAKDGREALEKIRKNPSCLGILLDLRMPNKDGFMFMEEKNKDGALRSIPVVIFSNLGQDEFIERATQLGAKGYLIKANHSIGGIIDEVESCFINNICHIDHE